MRNKTLMRSIDAVLEQLNSLQQEQEQANNTLQDNIFNFEQLIENALRQQLEYAREMKNNRFRDFRKRLVRHQQWINRMKKQQRDISKEFSQQYHCFEKMVEEAMVAQRHLAENNGIPGKPSPPPKGSVGKNGI